MKKLLSVFITFLLIAVSVNTLGATPKTAGYPQFPFDTSADLYQVLGFGTPDSTYQFMLENSEYVVVNITDSKGNVDYCPTPYKFMVDTETFQGFVSRAFNTQLQHAISVGFPTNEPLGLSYYFRAGVTNGINRIIFYAQQFYAYNISFLPAFSGGNYTVPSTITNSLQLLLPSDGVQRVPWTQIKRATLVVTDPNNNTRVVYTGDSKFNSINDTNLAVTAGALLSISYNFVTNGCGGYLTVATGLGTSSVYSLQDGSQIYPEYVNPILSIKQKNGQIVVNIIGGPPSQSISLQCYSDLSQPPMVETVTLDEVGTGSWTNTSTNSIGFFTTGAPLSPSLKH